MCLNADCFKDECDVNKNWDLIDKSNKETKI